MAGYVLLGDAGAEVATRLRRHAAVTGLALLESTTEEPSASTPQLLFGTGVPAIAAPNGSFAFRLDAPDGANAVYARIAGAWVTTGAAGGSTLALPVVVGPRWTEGGLLAGLVYADHDFADVADVVVSPGAMAWDNAGATKSAAPLLDAEFTGGAFVIRHDEVTTTRWLAPTFDAPFCRATVVDATAHGVLVECHIAPASMAGISVRNDAGLLIAQTGTDTKHASLIGVGDTIAGAFIEHRAPATVANVARTDLEMEVGHWLRLVILPDGSCVSYYYKAAAGSPPAESDWIHLGTKDEEFTPAEMRSLRVGVYTSLISGASTTTPWTISNLRIATAAGTVAVT